MSKRYTVDEYGSLGGCIIAERDDLLKENAALQSHVAALRAGMDEALFALYLNQPAAARILRQKYLPPADGERGS